MSTTSIGSFGEAGGAGAGSGWSRLFNFQDSRPPSEIRKMLERETLVLWAVQRVGRELRMKARNEVEGIQFLWELRFLSTAGGANSYALEASARWKETDREICNQKRRAAEGWFQWWTRELREAAPPSPQDPHSKRYGELSDAALSPAENLTTVASVQNAIVDGMKRGGTFHRVHKEGGTTIFWRHGKFVRLDFGDCSSEILFTEESPFLRMLREYHHGTVRSYAPGGTLPELDEWMLILRHMSGGRKGRGTLLGGGARLLRAGGAVLVVGAMAAWQFTYVGSSERPLGMAARSSNHVFQVMGTVERRLPGLRRVAARQRIRMDLRVASIAEPSRCQSFPLLTQPFSKEITPVTRILGVEGDVVWVQALDLFAVNLRTGRILRSADITGLNPELGGFLNTARLHFDGRLVAVSPDGAHAFAFPSDTFKATACPTPASGYWMEEQLRARFESTLCSGGWLSADEWLALAPRDEPRESPQPGKRLTREFSPGGMDRTLSVFRGTADNSREPATIRSCRRISDAEYPAGVLLRSRPKGDLLRLGTPDSVLLLSWKDGDYLLTRLLLEGGAVWSVSTGLGQLMQVLPGTGDVVLIGIRKPTQDQSAEPMLVVVETAKGQIRPLPLCR